MALIVQTASGVTGADSYVSLADADQRATDLGWADWLAATTGAREAALRNATLYIDLTYGPAFVGSASTALAWPRNGALPAVVKEATIFAARAALTRPLFADPTAGRAAKRSVRAGSVAVEYADSSTAELERERLGFLTRMLAPVLAFAEGGPAIFVV